MMTTTIPFDLRSFIAAGMLGFLAMSGSVTPSVADAKDIQVYTTMDRTFSPQTVRAVVGDRIVWTNNSRVRHEVSFSTNPTDSGEKHLTRQLPPNRTVSIIVTRPGVYDYACRWHGMWGKLLVDPKH